MVAPRVDAVVGCAPARPCLRRETGGDGGHGHVQEDSSASMYSGRRHVVDAVLHAGGQCSAAAGHERRGGRSGGLCVAVRRAGERRPEPLSACQWDMRAIDATSAGSYAVNQGQGRPHRRHRHRHRPHQRRHHAERRRGRVVRVPLCRHADGQPGRAGHEGRLLEQGGPAGPGRSRHPHRGDHRRADQRHRRRQASLPRPRSSCSRPERSRVTSSPSRSSTRCATPVTSTSTSST